MVPLVHNASGELIFVANHDALNSNLTICIIHPLTVTVAYAS
jgi:hypothetical protein